MLEVDEGRNVSMDWLRGEGALAGTLVPYPQAATASTRLFFLGGLLLRAASSRDSLSIVDPVGVKPLHGFR
jgi:hypothetical protein